MAEQDIPDSEIPDITDLLDRPIAFHRAFAKLAGSVNAGVMLSQGYYWSKRTKSPAGWFYKTQDEWEAETCLSRREQETARKLLRQTGFWEEDRRGNPARLYYRIDRRAFNLALFRLAQNANQDWQERPGKSAASRHTPRAPLSDQTEITTQTTERDVQLKIPRQPGSDDDLDDKAPQFKYTILKDPANFGYDILSVTCSMFPDLPIRGPNGFYEQWSTDRIVNRGLGKGRKRPRSTIREYAQDLENYLRKCENNRQGRTGNGYGNGAGKDAMSQSRFIAGPMSKEDRAEQMRVAAEFEDNIRRAGGKV